MVKNAVILAIIKRIRPLDPYLINSARGPKVARFAIHPTVSTRFTGGMLLLVDIVGQTVSVFLVSSRLSSLSAFIYDV